MAKTLHSNNITFIDLTDTKKMEVHIASNLPTTQIYDVNTGNHSPNWSDTPLILIPTVFADGVDITNDLTNSEVSWYRQVGNGSKLLIGTTKTLTISTNELTDPDFGQAAGVISYICAVNHNNKDAETQITFARVDTGKDGANGSSAPAVKAQYSEDGSTGWTATLDASTHKYIRLSYDNGTTWTSAIKIAGKDGTSVSIKGTATSKSAVSDTSYYTLVYNSTTITGAAVGDAYLLDGNLYVCVDSRDGNDYFMDVGHIQGPQGVKGDSYYLFIRYADNISGSGISASPDGKSYIGFYRSSVNQVPTDVSAATWNWAKFVGEDAKSITLTGSAQAFKINKSNVVSPATIQVTAQVENTTISSNGWTYSVDGGQTFTTTVPTGVSRSGNVVTLTGASITSNSIAIKATDGSHSDVFTVYKVSDGSDGKPGDEGAPAYTAFLTNESIAFVANSSGQIPDETIIHCNVVVYRGTEKVLPTLGAITGLPTGMTIISNPSTTETNELQLTIKVESKANLDSSQSTYGSINIPIVNPIGVNLKLSWSKINSGAKGDKGDMGVGIKSTTVDYGVSDSASVKPTTWQQDIPVVAEGRYLWTRTITDYTDTSKADTVTYVYTKQGIKGDTGTSGSSVTVKSIKYQAGASAITAPTGTWSDGVVAVAEGNYLWTQTTFSDNKVAYGVAKQGQKGDKGDQGPKGNDSYTVILTNESHIFAGDISNAIAGSATTQVLAYNGSTTQTVSIISVNNKTAATTDTDTGITGLKFKCSALSGTSPTITFTCTTSFVSKSGTIPIVLSVGGVQFTKMFTYSIAFKGATGAQGGTGTPASLVDITPSAHYFKSTTGKDGTFTPDYIYLYPRFQTVTFSAWQYSINGGTTWVAASGANGLSIGTYNSVANTLRIAKTSTLYTDAVTSISFKCVSSNSSVYDTVSIAKIYDVVDLQIGGKNYILNSENLSVSGLGSSNGSRMEYKYINVGQSYMNIESGTEVTISFDLEMTVNTANPTLLIYNTNQKGPKTIANRTLQFTAAVGETIKQRCSVTTILTDRTDTALTYNCLEFYSTYETYNWFKISNLKLEVGNKATDWSPAPEDLKSTTFQLYAPKGYLLTNDVSEITLETFAYDGSQQITNATFAWFSWNGEAWIALNGATKSSLVLDKSNVFKSGIYKCEMTYGEQVYTATATIEDKTDSYDSLIHVTSKYSPENRLYWVLYSTVYSEEGEKDKLLGPISVATPTSPTTGAYWYKIDESSYTVTLMKYSGTAWVTTTDKQEFVYDWFMLNDTNNIVTLGERSKVKIVTSDNFSRTCSVQCNVLDQELAALTHSNQVLNDPSDPIVSTTEPTNPINGQLWIKTGTNGLYTLLVWDASTSKWVVAEADTQKKVYVSKPTSYNDGDIWIVAAEYEPDAYKDGVLQTEIIEGVTKVVKHLAGTMLRAQYGSDTYKDSDWVSALTYKNEIDELKKNLNTYNQFFSFDNTGMTMKAKSLNGQISEFSTKLTNNELGFYQGENKVAYINNNQLNISKAEITNGMAIGGSEPMLQIGNFVIMQESNGSLSIGLKS